MTVRTEYEVCTSRGAIIKILDDRRAATKYAADMADEFPGLAVYEMTHHEPTRRRIYTPGGRARLALVAS